MAVPIFSAEATLNVSSNSYRAEVPPGRGAKTGEVLTAVGCSGVDCEAARDFCFAALDLDPISCGLYYGCCHGAGQTGGDIGGPQPDIPPNSSLPLTQDGPTLGDLSSQIANLSKQLKAIARCACPNRAATAWVPPSSNPRAVYPIPTPQTIPGVPGDPIR
jgi:hypothetical protein